jgi:3-hydroxyisobutyrate dehydrogenase-like beta-hydroxyacid dehydrogenase
VVDAPVSGTEVDIRAGRLTVLAGGEPEQIARCQPVMSAYANPIIAVGPLGSAQLVKLLNNALFAAQLALANIAIDVGRRFDIDASSLGAAVEQCSGASKALQVLTSLGLDPAQVVQGARPYLAKDLAVVEEVCGELGVDLGLLGQVARGSIGGRP